MDSYQAYLEDEAKEKWEKEVDAATGLGMPLEIYNAINNIIYAVNHSPNQYTHAFYNYIIRDIEILKKFIK